MEFIMRHAAALAALALLAACSDASEQTIIDSESGESVTLRTANDTDSGIAPPDNLPAFAPVYPGAVVTASVTGNPDEPKGMVAFTTADSEDAVIAFYRDKAKAAGLAEQTEMNMSGTRILSMGSGNTSDAGLQVTISPVAEENRRMVQIVYVTQ
jgi:hypothetical protein